ncbi:MAG: hypothetical protein JSU72_15855, partial [Deltaproteobacteria bacterium]
VSYIRPERLDVSSSTRLMSKAGRTEAHSKSSSRVAAVRLRRIRNVRKISDLIVVRLHSRSPAKAVLG